MFTVNGKIKGTSDFFKEIEEAVILEIRFHMAEVRITKSSNQERVGEVTRVLLNECELIESEENVNKGEVDAESHIKPPQDNEKFGVAIRASLKDGSFLRTLTGQKPLPNDVCQSENKQIIKLNQNGDLKCIKDVIMDDGSKEFSVGQEYRYWKGAERYFATNNSKRPHIIYNERQGDEDNFLSDHFEIIS